MALRRLLTSVLTTIAVTAGLVVAPASLGGSAMVLAAPAPAVVDSETLLHYDFSKVTGTTVVDSSPNRRDGVLSGSGAAVSGDVLTLPGGANNSGAAFVQIPTGTFDGRNTLTISSWLKNDTGAGNYAAMFFGTTQNLPAQYWLLNPRNPANQFKSVITNGLNTGAPYNTESGISPTIASRGTTGPVTDNSWALYTTVIEPNQITGYYNGTKVGTVPTTRTVTDFGTNLVSYIGKSSYPDAFYKGSVRDIVVYPTARTEAQVKDYYTATVDPAVLTASVTADAAAINLGGTRITENLTLPTAGAQGSTISWASSAPSVITTSGAVTRPASGGDVPVTLTATVTRGSAVRTRTFEVTVLTQNAAADLTLAAQRYVLRPTLVSGEQLPAAQTGQTATWSTTTSGATISANKLTVTGSAPVPATVRLTLSANGAEVTKDFTVTVLPTAQARYLLSYERTPVDTATYSDKLAYSMHLGAGTTTSAFTPLNDNYGVLFAKAVPTGTTDIVETRTLRTPYLFQLASGGYGVVATRSLANGADDDSARSSLLYFTSPDLKSWTEVGLVDLGVTNGVNAPKSVWDAADKVYRVTWTADDGSAFNTSFTDLAGAAGRGDIRPGTLTLNDPATTTTIPGAVPSATLAVPAGIASALNQRYGRTTNTAVTVAPLQVQANATADLDGVKAALDYSDGSTASLPVDWNSADVSAVNTAVAGTYTVRGTVRQRSYSAPFINAEADPDILKWKDSFLFISTDDAGVGINATNMYLRRSATIDGLKTAADHSVATTGGSGNIAGCFWAPELHEIAGELYIFFSPCVGQASWTRVQSYVQKLRSGGDPTVAADWGAPAPVLKADGSPLQLDAAHPGISLDMTYFEDGAKSYVAWSQRYITGPVGDAEIWIATVDKNNPWRLTSAPAKLVTSEYGWDTNTSNVAEGPFVVAHAGKLYLTYSGSNIDTTYTVGLLTATPGTDLTKQSAWTKANAPVMKSDPRINQTGPGHNSFTEDEDGNPVVVYHAKSTGSAYRDTYLRRVHWAADGRPVLDMTTDEEVDPARRAVTTTVVVTGNGQSSAPAAPAVPTATVNGTTVTAAWTKPADGGSAITGYTVTLYRADGTTVTSATVGAGTTSQRFTTLADGRYQVSVKAANAVGTSAESAKSTAVAVGAQLLARYDFAKITGTTVPDASGNGRAATLTGNGATVTNGELNLPGGSAGSGAAHVVLPTGMFDNQNTLTISAWLRNETGAGNYAAAFFGTTQNLPTQYWLLNPSNPAGQFKTVLTDGVSAGSPWTTETGISPTDPARGLAGPTTGTGWGLYTTVIQPGSITGYYNGVKIGTVPTTRTVSQFGTGLVGYLGRSSYPDNFYKGGLRDVSIFTTALSDADVADAYYAGLGDAAAAKAAVDADAAALNLGRTTIAADLALPQRGVKGSRITWSSSDPVHLAADGTVNRPTTTDATVTLTATLDLGGQKATRTFAVTVLANTPQKDLQLIADSYDPAIKVTAAAITLPTTIGAAAVAWTSSTPDVLTAAGVVNRPPADTEVTLTATFTAGGATETRTYRVTVLAADAGRLGTYIGTGNTDRTDALHLAVATDNNTTYTALNNNRPVLYPTLGSTKMGSPQLFRKPDGTFGLVATVDSNSSNIYLYDSTDLLGFTNERLVSFNSRGLNASAVSIAYDNGIAAYRATFVALADGKTYQITTKDLATFTAPVEVPPTTAPGGGTFPTGAAEASSIAITKAELDRLVLKFSRPVNNGVTPFKAVTIATGGQYTLPGSAEVRYSNGTTTTMGVQWDPADVAAIDTGKPGTYTVDGTVQRPSYANPLIERRADPDVIKGSDGFYYFTASYPMVGSGDPEGYDRVIIRKSTTIAGLASAPETTIWDEKNSSALGRYIWAPELHQINGTWYVFFTASDKSGVWGIRPSILKLNGTDPTDPSKWQELGRMKAAPGDSIAFTNFSLDMTYFENAGKHYVIWAEKPGASTLRMAQIDPANPQQLTTKSILLSAPQFAWEKNAGQAIDEGPAVLIRNGRIFVTFSAATVDDKYAVGLLTADPAADLLNPASWTKSPYPLLQTSDLLNEQGPGHNSFTVDEFGNPVIVYHSRTTGEVSGPGDQGDGGLYDPGRHARAATVHFAADGTPVFNLTATEELAEQYKNVQVQVVVTGAAPTPKVAATVTPAVDDDNGWYRSAPTVTLALTDGGDATVDYRIDVGAWTSYTAPVVIRSQGTHTLSYRAVRNGTEIAGTTGSVEVKVDTVSPVATATVSGRTVTVTATDATSGVATVEYQLDGGAWTAYTSPVTVDGKPHTVLARTTDKAGLVSGSVSVTVPAVDAPERAVPSLTAAAAPSADGWYNQQVLVSLQIPGGTKAQYRINGASWVSYTRSFSVSRTGINTVETRLLRSAVVVPDSTSAIEIKVDGKAPTTTLTRTPGSGSGSPRNPIAVSFAAADATSGVARTEYRINDGEWAATTGVLTMSTVGSYLVGYRSVDKAGNVEATRAVTVTIVADPVTRVKPNITKVAAGGYVTFTLSGYDRYDTVSLNLNQTAIGTVGTDVNGAAKVTLKIPAGTPKGQQTVVATGSDGQPTASTPLTVTG